jgi:hypothetical protein
MYMKVCDYVETLLEFKQLHTDPVMTKTDDFKKYNVSRDIYPYVALSYDPVFAAGYVYEEAINVGDYEQQLFNCICG